ncbi:MAG: xanthine dehydrogenase family protein molybdopterin-binding subunit [Chloroflexi bacterium]|nr:xanthine dehydrogenase family protein molybdopterin-binding subunit [Chloroflexota bacterium]MCI0781763.1 xanthine dehydrogenase family protein molybdopterin-binding subunit [Chloroflexota bacterium]MCI0785153.1 xanthine dehydrogenase family protein molybdopterin-binding subunit [Chloroflexota bacterium]MCI0794182.1 xanthine dehydrogenase family protein molybdopterin-binding subunit [Chloroflexota bacterium]MCI0824100.1 xanthine dehydrogenase family protein molybdopterin-binding subunit [Chl
MSYVGQPLKRSEDPRLLTGSGSFVDDMNLPDMAYAAVVRSQHAHALIKSVDASAARQMAGVLAVLTGEDAAQAMTGIPSRYAPELEGVNVPEHPVLAREKVCYVGQPVAVVVAEDPYVAKDAVDMVQVDYQVLPALTDPLEAAKDGATPIHPELGSNVVMRVHAGRGDVDRSFAEADRVVRGTYKVPRLSAAPMEGRALLVRYQPEQELLTLWSSTQTPHKTKTYLGTILNQPPANIRVIAPDVGGGFGQKVEVWPEDVALSYLAIKLERPVKWVEERWENMLAYHARDYIGEAEAAVKNDGTILAMRFRMVADMGGYFLVSSPGPPRNAAHRVNGPYAIPNMDVECISVFTNKPPTGPYRGAGGPEGAFFMERTIDLIAQELGLDPVDVRKRNFISPDAFPYDTATGLTYDSGDFVPALDRALDMADYAGFRRQQNSRGPDEPLIGVGIATVIKASGGSGDMKSSNALIRVEASGQVKVYTEVSPHGQGTETTFAQIVADQLGVEPQQVQILHGDTDMLERGQGTFASRGLTIGGSAMHIGLQQVRTKMGQVAAALLECSADDIEFQDGKIVNSRNPDHAMSFEDVAAAAQNPELVPPGMEPGLEFHANFDLEANPFSFGAHIAVVEIDRDTGALRFLRYAAVHDCGPVINPKLIEGQVHGAIAQGLGQARSEVVAYDDDGQPLNGTFMDYAIPKAMDMPDLELDFTETPSPTNPLGVKGIGELPTVAAPVAVANAVMDALSRVGVGHIDAPLTPEKIWQALHP